MCPAKLAGSNATRRSQHGWGKTGARSRRVRANARRCAPRGHGGGHRCAGRRVRLHHPARHGAADVAGLHRPDAGRFRRDREGPRAPGHPLRAEERRRHRARPARPDDPRAHEARRRRPAQGRRRRVRDFRQVRHARRDLVRAEHQSPARARRRACAHHQGARPGAGGARASGSARAAAVLARQDRAFGLDRAARARRARGPAGAGDPPSRCLGGERPEAAARLDRGRSRPAFGRRGSDRRHGQHRRLGGRAPRRLREAPERPGRIDRLVGGRAGTRPRAALGRIRLQPNHRDARQVRSRGARAALQPDARRDPPRPAIRKARSASATSCRARSRIKIRKASRARRSATKARSRKKSSTTRSRARPKRR